MAELPSSPRSLWRTTLPPAREPLDGPADVDVVVIGAGITGLSTAVLAAQSGCRVLVIEDRSLGAGATGFSTAKVSVLHGLKYSKLARQHSTEVAARYAAAQMQGLSWLRSRAPGFEPATALTYATDDTTRGQIEDEVAACQAAGISARLVETLDVPYPTRGAVAVDEQGQIDPLPLLAALGDEVESLGGRIVERTRALAVRDGRRRAIVRTSRGDVRAQWVVVATGLPFLDRSLLFARTEPKASYVLAVRTSDPLPSGMLLSAGEPLRSLRTAPDPDRDGERLLLVGGESHKTGDDAHPARRYQALLDWTTERFAVETVPYRWATEDFMPDDGLPFVGSVWPLPTRVQVATGYAKWGFTNGVAAAHALVATITDTAPPDYAADWDTRRPDVLRGAREVVKANVDVAAKLIGGWTGALARDHTARPTVTSPVGGAGAVSAVCTHLGGIVRWNDGDQCWDCPLHGSRFEPDGTLLHGPAVRDLKRRPRAKRTRLPDMSEPTTGLHAVRSGKPRE